MEKIDIDGIKQDYAVGDEFSEDSDRVVKMKRAVSELPETDNTLFLLYTEMQSYRKLGKLLGMSHTLVMKEIQRIRKTIINKMNNGRFC